VDLSKQSQYALLAMAYLAGQPPRRLVPIREIGANVDVPRPFLSKILARLSRGGLVTARRGPHGGVMLSRSASRTSLGEVVELLDGTFEHRSCYLGLPGCDDRNPCPLHATWKKVRAELDRKLHELTVDDLRNTRPAPPARSKSARRRRAGEELLPPH
jgi:Rrf2 family iron-sulfur cluster assembly transcriptional regulator